jgi:hypothetical protein
MKLISGWDEESNRSSHLDDMNNVEKPAPAIEVQIEPHGLDP